MTDDSDGATQKQPHNERNLPLTTISPSGNANQPNEVMLWDITGQNPIAIGILRGPTFVVEMANLAMCEIWNRTSEQLLGYSIFEVLTEAVGQGFEELLTGVLQTGIPFEGRELPVTLIRNGLPEPVVVNFIYQPLYAPNSAPKEVLGIMVTATDITAEFQAKKRSQEETQRLKTLFEQAPVGMAILGLHPDLIFELANPFYCQITNREPGQLIGKPLLNAMPELQGQGFDVLLTQVMTTGIPFASGETPVELLRRGKLETIYVDFVYQPRYEINLFGKETIMGVVVIVTDITQTVQARQLIETKERLLNTMIRQTPLGVAVFRKPNFVIELANPTICRLWDRTPEQVLEQPLFEALPEAAGQGFEELLAGVYETGIPFEGHELPARIERNGQVSPVYFDFVYEPLLEPDGRIERIMVVATDATLARQARLAVEETEALSQKMIVDLEARVKERTQDLERSNLDLMQFASVASHDLKEPLRKVQTFGTQSANCFPGDSARKKQTCFSDW